MQTFTKHPEYDRYEVSRDGVVFDSHLVKVMKVYDNGNGYKQVLLEIDGKMRMRYVHRMVAQTYLDNPESCKYVGHKDHDRGNNTLPNLYWTHASGNTRDGVKAGRINYKGRYTNGFVCHNEETICAAYVDVKRGGGLMDVSRKYGVSRTTLSSWVHKRSWTELTDLLDEMMAS